MKENMKMTETEKSLVVSIFGPNLQDQSKGQFVVHAADCKDCAKLRKLRETESKGTFSSILEISADLWSDMILEGSMTAEDGLHEIHFCPCVKLPHGKVVDGEIVSE